jgi:hypothetical protein
MECPTRDVLIQHRAPRIETSPQGGLIGPVLAEQRLQGHRLMGALNLGVVGRLAFAGEAHIDS